MECECDYAVKELISLVSRLKSPSQSTSCKDINMQIYIVIDYHVFQTRSVHFPILLRDPLETKSALIRDFVFNQRTVEKCIL